MNDRLRNLPNGIPVVKVEKDGIPVVGNIDSGGNIEETDPIYNREKNNYYLKTEVDEKLTSKVNITDYEEHLTLYRGLDAIVRTNVYKKDETMSKEAIEASQAIQDTRIKALEDGGVPPGDTYSKTEIDDQQAKQDVEISKCALQNNVYSKTETYSIEEIDASQKDQNDKLDAHTNILTNFTTRIGDLEKKEESDPHWEEEKTGYRKAEDQDIIDNNIKSQIGAISSDVENLKIIKVSQEVFNNSQNAQDTKIDKNIDDITALTTRVGVNETKNTQQDTKITALEGRAIVAAEATALTNLIDTTSGNSLTLTFQAAPKFYTNSNVFSLNGTAINNNNTTDATNVIKIKGELPIRLAGLVSLLSTLTISCPDDINGVTYPYSYVLTTELQDVYPFEFTIPGNKATTSITVNFSGLSGLTARQLKSTYITFRKLK